MTAQSGMGDHRVMPVEHFRTENQVRPHESFKSTAIAVKSDRITKTAGERTMTLAVPAGWTAQAKPCDRNWDEYDDHRAPDPDRESSAKRAMRMCAGRGCPVMAECLSAALREEEGREGPKRPDQRHGVRGGLTPYGRWKIGVQRYTLALQLEAREQAAADEPATGEAVA